MTEEAQNMYTGTTCLCRYQHEHLAVYHDTHALHTLVASAFSWDGMTDQTGYPPSGKGNPYLANGTTPVFQEWDLPGGNATAAAGVITSRAPKPDNEPHFQVYRTVLQVGTARQCDTQHHVVPALAPSTLSCLARHRPQRTTQTLCKT